MVFQALESKPSKIKLKLAAIINPPEAGILAVGRIEPRAVVHDGQVVVRRRMRMTLSCDHRVVDGATVGRRPQR